MAAGTRAGTFGPAIGIAEIFGVAGTACIREGVGAAATLGLAGAAGATESVGTVGAIGFAGAAAPDLPAGPEASALHRRRMRRSGSPALVTALLARLLAPAHESCWYRGKSNTLKLPRK